MRSMTAAKRREQRTLSESSYHFLANELMNEIQLQAFSEPTSVSGFGVESGESGGSRINYDDVDDYHLLTESPQNQETDRLSSNFRVSLESQRCRGLAIPHRIRQLVLVQDSRRSKCRSWRFAGRLSIDRLPKCRFSKSCETMMGPSERSRRKGVLYLHVLFTAAVVAAIATSALRFHRSQAFEVQLARDFDAAKRHAHAAVDIAMLRMRKYQDWRTRFNQSQWWNNASIDGGFYSVSVEDPVDLDLANDSRDPVLIKAVGTHNAAVYRLQVTVEVVPANGSCLDVTLMAADDISVSDAAVVCDQIIGCNSNVAASNSTIYSDVEAAQNISVRRITGLELRV